MFAIPFSIALYAIVCILGLKIFNGYHRDVVKARKMQFVALVGFGVVFVLFVVMSVRLFDRGDVDGLMAVLFMWILFLPALVGVFWGLVWMFMRAE